MLVRRVVFLMLLTSVMVYFGLKFMLLDLTSGVGFGQNAQAQISGSRIVEPELENTERAAGKVVRIAVGIGVLESLARELVRGTGIEIVQGFSTNSRIAEQQALIIAERFNPKLDPASVSACIDLRGTSADSRLFSYLRSQNIGVIEIDVGSPVGVGRRSPAVIYDPQTGSIFPNLWLSPENTLNMIDVMSEDIARILPECKEQLESNQVELKRDISELTAKYVAEFSNYTNTDVLVLCKDFYYLLNSFQLFGVARMDDDGRAWKAGKLAELQEVLLNNEVRVVLHRWEPDDGVVRAIEEAGAELVILDPMNKVSLRTDGYVETLQENLQHLREAFASSVEGE